MIRLFPALLFFLMLKLSDAQSVYSLQQDDSVRIRYSVAGKADSYSNQILRQLALAHLKIPEKTSFVFHFNYGASIRFQQGNLLDVSVSLTPTISLGDVKVRDFDIQELLVPSHCAISAALIHPVKGEVFTVKRDRVPLAQLISGITVDAFPDSLWSSGCRLVVDFRKFGYTEEAFLAIGKELNAIRDYYAASALSDTVEHLIRKARIRLHTPVGAFRTYVFCEKSMLLLNEAVGRETEIIPGADPDRLHRKVPVTGFRLKELVEYFNREGIEAPLAGNLYLNLALAFSGALQDALSLSQKVDYYSSPFYYRLYSNSTSAGQLHDAAGVISQFALKHRLKSVDFGLLSRRITDEIILLGDRLMQEGRYAEALDLLNAGNRFCNVNPDITTPGRLLAATTKARSGLTASYIRIVEKALNNNLPGLADKYLSEAVKYTEKSGMTAADSSAFAGLYGVLTGKNIQTGYQHLNNRDYQSALTEFEKAIQISARFDLKAIHGQAEFGLQKAVEGIYTEMFRRSEQALRGGNTEQSAAILTEADGFAENYPVFKPDPVAADSLRKQIALAGYNSLLGQAACFVKVSDMRRAVDILLTAAGLARDNRLSNTAFFDSLVAKAALVRVNEMLSDSRLKLWAGEPEIALTIAAEAMQLASMLDLGSRADIREQVKSLTMVADESLCSRIKGELASLVNRADDAFRLNKFSEAADLVFQARELIYSRASCGLNPVDLNQVIAKYEHPVRWNTMVKDAGALILAGDFVKGSELMQQAGAVFNYYRLDTLGLVNEGLFEFALTSDHVTFIRQATGYYIARGGYDQALQLLDRLRLAGALPDETAGLQESLARVLAERDVEETGTPDLKRLLKVYTNGNKWYRRFSEVYRYHVENHQ